jgi:hypothetical protein
MHYPICTGSHLAIREGFRDNIGYETTGTRSRIFRPSKISHDLPNSGIKPNSVVNREVHRIAFLGGLLIERRYHIPTFGRE